MSELQNALKVKMGEDGWVDAWRVIHEAARRVTNPDLQQWIDEAALALDAATTIGQRSCNPGDHLHYANHDRLVASKPNLAALGINE